LGVPYQGRHVLQHDRDPDVVHRCVGECLDEPVGGRATAEQPQVAGTGAVDRGGQRYGGDAHGSDPASAAVAVGLSLWVWHRVAGNGSRPSGRPASWGSRRPEHWSRGASVSGGRTSRTRSGSVCTPGTHASSRGGMPTTAPGTDTYCSADILAASCPPLSSPPPACVVPGTTCSSVSTRSAPSTPTACADGSGGPRRPNSRSSRTVSRAPPRTCSAGRPPSRCRSIPRSSRSPTA